MGIALTVQVIGHRIIMPGMLLPILLFFYKLNEVKNVELKSKYYIIFALTLLVVFVHFNFSTGLILGEWESVDEAGKMIMSNEILRWIFE